MAKASPRRKRKTTPARTPATRRPAARSRRGKGDPADQAASAAAAAAAAPRLVPVIEAVPVEQINPAPYNPSRPIRPGDPGFDRLKAAIETFGSVQLLVWNRRTGHLVGGHQTLSVLQAIDPQLETVHCSVVDLPEPMERALNLRLNRRATDDDPQRLGQVLQEILEADLDAGLTGLDPDAINHAIAEMEAAVEAAAPAPGSSDAGDSAREASEAGDTSGGGGASGGELPSSYKVVAECDGEDQQRQVYELLRRHEIRCRVLTLH